MTVRLPLPIDDVLADVVAAVESAGAAVLVAPPGAGKTTRVPPALLEAGLAGEREVVVLQPRRLAARMAAARVAAELGEPVGETVGYEVRFDRRVGERTRVRFVTENVLNRQLIADPELRRVGVVVVDELHERHLAGDLALALVQRLRRGARPDLRVVAMSATLDAGPVAAYLGGCPIVESAGRQFPVDVEYRDERREQRALERRVAGAIRDLVRDGLDGDVLVFLPGAGEIRRAQQACEELAQQADLLVLPLHGNLSAAEQDRAVAPAPRRKVILATNVAETSITIAGVVAVVDSGLARVARHSPWSGLPVLHVEPISRASAAQRAGRAGRVRPGRCLRLYDRHDHDSRREFDAPEILRADLTEVALSLHAVGVTSAAELEWLDAPPAQALEAAEALLERLGAVTDDGRVTELGRRMARIPAHPRQARIAVEADAAGVGDDGCVVAALIGERVLRREQRGGRDAARVSGPSDLLHDLDLLRAASDRGRLRADLVRSTGLDPAAAFAVDRAARQLARSCSRPARGTASEAETERALLRAVLAGYPDRVARRREGGGDAVQYLLAGGGAARLSPSSVVRDAPFIVAVEVEERGRGGERAVTIERASAVDPDWLLESFLDRIDEVDELSWAAERERVERVRRLSYDGLVIEERRDTTGARELPERAAQVLADAAFAAGIDRFIDREALERWRARLAFASQHDDRPALRPPDDDAVRAALVEACAGRTSFRELREVSLLELLQARCAAELPRLERLAPTHVELPGRRRVPVHYELDRPPWIESRMQDFFGLARTPAVAAGAVPLVLHLLAPNRRAVQVTTDLAGFWQRHYPELRRQLSRRYPRHAWPDDPLAAVAADARRR